MSKYKFFGGLLLAVMAVLAILGALVGLLFGQPLIGAGIGAMIPIAWVVVGWCLLKGFEELTRGQWG